MSSKENLRSNAEGCASYLIKTFGGTLADVRFNRLPTVIQKAKLAIPSDEIVGFLACAIEISPRMTGLMFCDYRNSYPQGLPARTPPIRKRFEQAGYLVVEVTTGGLYVVAHWYFENGAIGPFYSLQ